MDNKIQFGFGFQWHLTDICDQRCAHCYVWKEKESQREISLNSSDCIKIIENISYFENSMDLRPTVALTGGDPLLYPYFWEIAEEISVRKWNWLVLGNPFHLTSEVAARLKELGCNRYQMSIDGMKQTHDRIRKEGSFDITLSKIKILRDAGITSLIMTTVSNWNIGEIPEVTNICVENGADLIAFSRYGGNGNNGILAEEYRYFLGRMYNHYWGMKGKGSNFSYKDHLWKLFFFENNLVVLDDEVAEIVDGCHCGFGHLSILPNGDVFACRRFNSLVGNALKSSINDIFFSKKMEEYREIDQMECGRCELKYYCRGCPAVSYGEYGDWRKRDPQCWKKI